MAYGHETTNNAVSGFMPVSGSASSPFTPRNTIQNGDCTRLMAGMKGNSVDFILTDPPYITR
ncbi:hypothetical protein LQT97_13170 [Brucella pseudogrignonensis]|uniref:hypothetical protein n=1 Tax=Brucella pseudogrignonensis TaxID=419475 RepID=UPI001E529AFE|nr:hypothetical protein [Brucella pseudogrignonensis]MCD4512180.1 hypothetical protein [Brucella pseudogrignonensis]